MRHVDADSLIRKLREMRGGTTNQEIMWMCGVFIDMVRDEPTIGGDPLSDLAADLLIAKAEIARLRRELEGRCRHGE